MEALILFFVIFFPGISSFPPPAIMPEVIHFSVLGELARLLTYTLPSFALLWYIISDKKGLSALADEKPKFNDLIVVGAGLPALIGIGICVSIAAAFFTGNAGLSLPPKVEAPSNAVGYIVMIISCFGTGYLEESYFRYYIYVKYEKQFDTPAAAIILSTLLFSACHVYEGIWGIINAALAGLLLSLLFFRYRSLHGLAWAHGAYNIFVYVMGNFTA
jgi:membrane protease YdiL (CAAX protease family)